MFRCRSDLGESMCVGSMSGWYGDGGGSGVLITIGAESAGAFEFLMSPDEAERFAKEVARVAGCLTSRSAKGDGT